MLEVQDRYKNPVGAFEIAVALRDMICDKANPPVGLAAKERAIFGASLGLGDYRSATSTQEHAMADLWARYGKESIARHQDRVDRRNADAARYRADYRRARWHRPRHCAHAGGAAQCLARCAIAVGRRRCIARSTRAFVDACLGRALSLNRRIKDGAARARRFAATGWKRRRKEKNRRSRRC